MPAPNSRRFLNAFNRIEKHLFRITRNPRRRRFRELVENASVRNPMVARFKDDLREFSELRNAIVHETTDGRVIAEPNDEATAEIERIADLITDPPRIRDLPEMKVFTLSPGDPARAAIRKMYEGAFSQIPVYEGKDFRGLLTMKTVLRWLGARADGDVIDLRNVTVAEVLEHAEEDENHRFLGPDVPLQEAADLFQYHVQKGKRLNAVLVTDSGLPTGKLLNIITIWDLPKIRKKIE